MAVRLSAAALVVLPALLHGATATAAAPRGGESLSLFDKIERLKKVLHTLSPEEAKARLAEIKSTEPPPPHQDKIDHFVVLLMENHSFDVMFGCMDLPGADSIPKTGRRLPVDPTNPQSTDYVNVTCGTAPYVCAHGPGYATFSPKFQKGANSHTYPYDEQSDDYSVQNGATEGNPSVSLFAPEALPVKHAVAKDFGVFNKLYSAVPSASTPNHLMIQVSLGLLGLLGL